MLKPRSPNTCENVEYENGLMPFLANWYAAIEGNKYCCCGALTRTSCTHWPSNPTL